MTATFHFPLFFEQVVWNVRDGLAVKDNCRFRQSSPLFVRVDALRHGLYVHPSEGYHHKLERPFQLQRQPLNNLNRLDPC